MRPEATLHAFAKRQNIGIDLGVPCCAQPWMQLWARMVVLENEVVRNVLLIFDKSRWRRSLPVIPGLLAYAWMAAAGREC